MKQKGLTLIELLVVVAIIGILAAVGVVAYNGYTSSAKKAAAKANHKQVVKFFQGQIMMCALDRYEMEHTSWPQCTKHKSWCNSSTDVAVFQSTFSNKFRCEMNECLVYGIWYYSCCQNNSKHILYYSPT